jgi:hypothetical protein
MASAEVGRAKERAFVESVTSLFIRYKYAGSAIFHNSSPSAYIVNYQPGEKQGNNSVNVAQK